MFFLIYFMLNCEVTMEGGMCFMSSTVRLDQVVKWPFLMAWSKVLFNGLKRDAWYHLAISGLLLSSRTLSAIDCLWLGSTVGLLVILTCHMPDVVDLFPSSTVIPSLTKLRRVAVKVAMQPSSYSFPIDIRSPYCRWGKTWAVRAAWVNRGFRLNVSLWVACMMMPSCRMTWGPLLIS